ncbi:MAG: sugar phosphate isomerase/epimerase family protein [Vicinamibacterales bacterium]
MPSFLTRRAFLERTSLTATAAAFIPRWMAAAQASGMFISLNGGVAQRTGWPEFARLAARTGYAGVDFPLNNVRMAGVDATRALLSELKLQPTITGIPADPRGVDPAAFQTALAGLEEAAKFMQDIGATRMMAVMPATVPAQANMSFDEYRTMYKTRLTAIDEVLRRHNIRLGLEFLGPMCFHLGNCGGGGNRARGAGAGAAAAAPGAPAGAAAPAAQAAPAPPAAPAAPAAPVIPFIHTLNETVKLATEAGPNIGVILDVWHWHHSGSTVADILATDKSRIVHVHISDAKAMAPADVRDNMRFMPGEGIIDYNGFFGALKKIGYTGGVAPEPLGRIPMEMSPDEAAKLGYDTAAAVMKKAGVF